MDRKKIVLQSLLISGIVSLGAVLSAQALSLKGDAITTNTNGLGSGTSLNTNINTSTTVTTTTTTTSTSTANDADIQFNEFFGDSTTGWVELYNAGSTPVDVTNWLILSNKSDSQILTGIVAPKGYATFNGITADSLATLQSDMGQVIDTQTYTAVTTTQSWSQYTTNVFACDASPTKLAANSKQTCTTTNSNENTNTTTNQNSNTNTNTANSNENTNTTNTNTTNSNTNTNAATTTETTGGVNATSSLYVIDRAWESLRLALTIDDEKEAELALDYAAERLAEAEDIVTEEQQTQVGETNTNNTNNTNNVNTQQTTTTDNSSTVKLSEVVHKDYIELYNPGTKAVDITGYTLEVKDVAGVKTYVLPTTVVESGKYIVISAGISGLQLDETGGRVRLLDITATAVSTALVPYDVYANAWAFNLINKQWDCTSTATKEAENVFTDCVAKTDEQVPVNQNTNIGTTENTNEVVENTNEEVVTETKEELKDTDQDGLTDETETENATDPEVADTDGDGVDDANDPEPITDKNQDDSSQTDDTAAVKLSEVVHEDYIELYNPGAKAIDLTGYILEVEDAEGLQTYVLPTIIVEAGKYVAIFATTSALEVDKAGGRVRLLNTAATEVGTVLVPYDVYGNSWSFNSTAVKWDCTSTATKEAENVFTDCVKKTDDGQVPVNQNTNSTNTNEPVGNTNQPATNTTTELIDTDQDGLTDETETENATDPEVADTDGDGVDDANDPEPTGDDKTNENQDDSSQTDDQVWLSEVVHEDYIELLNPGTKAIDLTGYVLEVNDSVSTQSYTLPAIIIEPGKYVAVFTVDSGLKVPANGGIVSLLNSSKTVIDKTIVPLNIIGNSWSFNSTKVKWDCTSTATKEAENVFTDCVAKTDEQVPVNQNTNTTNQNTNTAGTTEQVENQNTNSTNTNQVAGNTNQAATNTNTEAKNDNINEEVETANTNAGNTNQVVENTNEPAKEEIPTDTDGDGIVNELEEQAGTDPEKVDTDGDGVDDPNDQTPTEANEDKGTELSEEAAAAVEETMTDFEELVDHAGEQEVSEEAAATNAETLTELVDKIETIQEEVAGETDQTLEEAKTNAEEQVVVLEKEDEGEVTNENINKPEENINEEVKNENENTNEVVNENGDENINAEEENTNGEIENSNDNSNENVNENANTANTNEAADNTNALSNDNTNSESNDTVVTEDIDAQRLQEELDLAIDEINKLREENEALKAKIKELEDKLYATTGEKVSEVDVNTNIDSGSESSLTGNDKYSIVKRESQLPDFTNVVGHVYFRELRAQPGDFTSTAGEYAFHNLDKVMYKLTLPDGSTSAAIYPGEVFIMDLEGGEYIYSSVNHPDFGPYKITIE